MSLERMTFAQRWGAGTALFFDAPVPPALWERVRPKSHGQEVKITRQTE